MEAFEAELILAREPVIKGARIPVYVILNLLGAGYNMPNLSVSQYLGWAGRDGMFMEYDVYR